MSKKDLNKYDVIQSSLRKEITVKKAGELLHLTERQVYNLRAKVKEIRDYLFLPSNHLAIAL